MEAAAIYKPTPKLEIIPPVSRPEIQDQKLNVAAYCRVSTKADEQLDSLQTQREYFADYVDSNKNWTLIDVYYDKGITGTSRKHRDGFNKMIALAERGEIDLIITKEVSRFARNVVDTLSIARALRSASVYVLFTSDELNTESVRDMDRLTDLATQAERESQKTSLRVRWGQRERMKKGVVFGRDMLGYTVKDGQLFINEAESEIVRMIYRLFLAGDGTHVIARKLREAGYEPKNPDGKAHYKNGWSNTVILRVLRNEKYCGDLLQKKTITIDSLEHTKKYNEGEEEKIVIHDHHEPIIDHATWDAVQAELIRRAPNKEQKAKHSNRYWCSGKIKCGVCGCSFVSRKKTVKRTGETYKAWWCFEKANHGKQHIVPSGNKEVTVGCNTESVNEKVLVEAIKLLLDYIMENRETLKAEILQDLEEVRQITVNISEQENLEAQLEKLRRQKRRLVLLYADETITKEEFEAAKVECQEEIFKLEQELGDVLDVARYQREQETFAQEQIKAIDNILAFDSEASETVYKEVTDKIVVQPGHYLDLYLHCLPFAVRLHYLWSGRLSTYKIDFDSLEILKTEAEQG